MQPTPEQTGASEPQDPGLAGGLVPVPAWVVIVLGSLLVLFVVGFFVARYLMRSRAQRRRGPDSLFPPSSRR